ncbi:MAG: MarR family transcriptional regulator [Thaumarchaeota archaeon]|nr:MarR family transcriptional regulator [Nitrososphaerota archaeon]
MVSENRLQLLILSAPLPVLFALGWRDSASLLRVVLNSPLPLISLLFLAVLSLGYGAVRLRPLLNKKPSALGALALLGSLTVYVVGSYLASAGLHWIALTLFYFGFVVFVGGRGQVVPLAFSALPLTALVSPLYFTDPTAFLPEGLAISLLLLYIAGLWGRRGLTVPACDNCPSYRRAGDDFCSYCGRNLSTRVAGLSRSKLGKAAALSLALIVLSAFSVPYISVSSTGVIYVHSGFSGAQSEALLPTSSTWALHNMTHRTITQYVSIYSFVLVGGGKAVNLWMVTSPFRPSEEMVALIISKISPVAPSSPSTNQTSSALTWVSGNRSYIGFSDTTNTLALENGTADHLFVTTYAGEGNSTFAANQGAFSRDVVQLIAQRVADAQYFVPVFQFFLTFPSVYTPYVETGAVIVALGAVMAAVRVREIRTLKRIENTWGLSPGQFSILASLSTVKGPHTGSELLETVGETHGVGNWNVFLVILRRFAALGLVEQRVRVRGGIPSMFWYSTVI